MNLEDITYSREATIAAVTDYYTFLTRMYLNESDIAYPPPGGWPSIVNANPAVVQSLGESDEVLALLALLAHLPYIQHPLVEPADPAPNHTVADWSDFIGRLRPDKDDGTEFRIMTENSLAHISPPPRYRPDL